MDDIWPCFQSKSHNYFCNSEKDSEVCNISNWNLEIGLIDPSVGNFTGRTVDVKVSWRFSWMKKNEILSFHEIWFHGLMNKTAALTWVIIVMSRELLGVLFHRPLDCFYNDWIRLTKKPIPKLCLFNTLRGESTENRWFAAQGPVTRTFIMSWDHPEVMDWHRMRKFVYICISIW